MDSSLVVETISRLNSEKAVKNSNYATSFPAIPSSSRRSPFRRCLPEELAESIQWEAEQYIPFDINDVNLDYVPLSTSGSGDNIDVILVAVKKEKINDYTSVISQTGKERGAGRRRRLRAPELLRDELRSDEGKTFSLSSTSAPR